MKDTFSIVIPVLNRAELLPRTLDSIARQTYRPIRVIVADNGSTDGTAESVSAWSKANVTSGVTVDVITENKAGACAARNTGFRLVKSRYMAFFDSDDTMCPTLVQDAVNALERANGDNTLVAWKARLHIDEKTRVLASPHRNPLRSHLFHSILSTQRIAAPAELFRRAGLWNESLSCWNDWEFAVRILLQNPEVVFIDKVLVDIHHQAASITGESFSSKAGEWESSLLAVADALRSSGRHQDFIPLVAYRAAILAAHYRRETARPDIKTRAAKIMNEIATTPLLSHRDRQLIRLSYLQTRLGLPGASRLFGRFL